MRLLLSGAIGLFALYAQPSRLSTTSPLQGAVVRVTAPLNATAARLNGRITRLFPDQNGLNYGLVPVPVLEKPGSYALELLDAGGRVLESSTLKVLDARFRRQNVTLSASTTALKPSPREMDTVRAFRETVSDVRHWTEPFERPVAGCMTSPFGVLRLHNGKPTGSFHGGLDQRGPTGDPVRAVAAGKVSLVRMFNIHGGTVGIDHGHGLTSIYLHMSKFAVEEGALVKQGDVIGYVGSTGRSNAPHLHWSLYAHGIAVNPQQWIKVPPCSAPPKTRRR